MHREERMRIAKPLTKRSVEALKPIGKEYFVWDSQVSGFGVRVRESGRKTFIFRFRPSGTRTDQRNSIGTYPSITVDTAREAARQLYAQVAQGRDPAAERRNAKAARTVQELSDYFLTTHAQLKDNRASTLNGYRSSLNRHLLKQYGNRKLAEFTRADMSRLMHSLKNTPVAANHLRRQVSAMYNVAIKLDWAESNPCKGISMFREQSRERFLSTNELVNLMRYLNNHKNQNASDIVKLLLLTGARKTELLSAKWEMFDLEQRLWIKPSSHTKQRRTHTVVLSDLAASIILRRKQAKPKISTTPYVFPMRNNQERHTDNIVKFWRQLQLDLSLVGFRIHDLRHTSASLLVSQSHSLAEVGGVLGHTQAITTMRYAHLYREAKERSAATLETALIKASKS